MALQLSARPWLLLCAAPLCNAAGGVSIFKLGPMIDNKNWDVMGMYFIVFGVTIMLELIVHQLHRKIKSNSGTAIVHHVTKEVMILGGISAVLVVFENLGGGNLIDATLFHYVHFVIFLMMIIFIVQVAMLFLTVNRAWDHWEGFENQIFDIESDPTLDYNAKTAFMKQYVQSVHGGMRMLATIIFFRANIPQQVKRVTFTRYMKKRQRRFMIELLDVHHTSWGFLAVLVVAEAILAKISTASTANPLVIVALWALLIGFVPLFIVVVMLFKVRHSYRNFTSNVMLEKQRIIEGIASGAKTVDGAPRPGTAPMDVQESGTRIYRSQHKYFWRGSPSFMLNVLQVLLLCQVFYTSSLIANFSYRLLSAAPRWGWVACIVAFLPTVMVFFVVVPSFMPPFSIIASTGEYIDYDCLVGILLRDKTKGRYRRGDRRDETTVTVAPFLRDRDGVFDCLEAITRSPPVPQRTTTKCEECGRVEPAVVCGVCGYLCESCDFAYHKLKKTMQHTRTPLRDLKRGETAAAKHGMEMMLKRTMTWGPERGKWGNGGDMGRVFEFADSFRRARRPSKDMVRAGDGRGGVAADNEGDNPRTTRAAGAPAKGSEHAAAAHAGAGDARGFGSRGSSSEWCLGGTAMPPPPSAHAPARTVTFGMDAVRADSAGTDGRPPVRAGSGRGAPSRRHSSGVGAVGDAVLPTRGRGGPPRHPAGLGEHVGSMSSVVSTELVPHGGPLQPPPAHPDPHWRPPLDTSVDVLSRTLLDATTDTAPRRRLLSSSHASAHEGAQFLI